jgi:hypothetical protein
MERRPTKVKSAYIPFVENLLVRPIEAAPPIVVSPRDLVDWYLASANFITGDCYPRGTHLLDGEAGYLAIISGRRIYPVARVLCAPESEPIADMGRELK